MGFVYVIEFADYYKIGKTDKTVEQRISSMQFPTLPRIIAVYETAHALLLEQFLHKKLKPRRIRNEWFSFDSDKEAIILTEAYANEFKIDQYTKERNLKSVSNADYSLDDVIKLSSVEDESTFWFNYNLVKSNSSSAHWKKIKSYFVKSIFYQDWNARRLRKYYYSQKGT